MDVILEVQVIVFALWSVNLSHRRIYFMRLLDKVKNSSKYENQHSCMLYNTG